MDYSNRYLRFFGIGESTLSDHLEDLIEGQTNPTIAPYAIKFNATYIGKQKKSAELLGMELCQSQIERGNYYGYGDLATTFTKK